MKSDWLMPAALIALSLVPAAASVGRLAELARAHFYGVPSG